MAKPAPRPGIQRRRGGDVRAWDGGRHFHVRADRGHPAAPAGGPQRGPTRRRLAATVRLGKRALAVPHHGHRYLARRQPPARKHRGCRLQRPCTAGAGRWRLGHLRSGRPRGRRLLPRAGCRPGPRPDADRARRCDRCRERARHHARAVAAALRRQPRRARPAAHDWGATLHDRRRDAGRRRIPARRRSLGDRRRDADHNVEPDVSKRDAGRARSGGANAARRHAGAVGGGAAIDGADPGSAARTGRCPGHRAGAGVLQGVARGRRAPGAGRPVRRGRTRALRRLRERGQPDAGARRGAARRVRGASRARRQPRTHGASDAAREPDAGGRRRRRRMAGQPPGPSRLAGAGSRRAAANRRHRGRRRRGAVRLRARGAGGHGDGPRAGALGGARRFVRVPPRRPHTRPGRLGAAAVCLSSPRSPWRWSSWRPPRCWVAAC